MRILIVEDETSIGLMLADVLEDAGYAAWWVLDARAALDIVPQYDPNLVLCDHMLPGMLGTTFCTWLRHDPRYVRLPTILMSAGIDASLVQPQDYTAFLRKPFTIPALLRLVQEILHHPS